MVDSVNTNAGSLLGVRNLQSSSKSLANTQNQLATGKKISSAKDNAAVLSITQILKSDVAGLNSVKASLDRAISTTDVALAAGNQVADLLVQLKEKAVQAADPGLDNSSRLSLNDEFTALRGQINSVVDNASFNGTNPVKAAGDDITALVGPDGQDNITVPAQDLSLGGTNVTLSDTQNISTASAASTAIAIIEDSINNVSSALSELGAASQQLQATKDFAETLQAKTQEGIGNLVDADIAKANAEFTANQVRQALGAQSLSISNQQPAAILSLFQNG